MVAAHPLILHLALSASMILMLARGESVLPDKAMHQSPAIPYHGGSETFQSEAILPAATFAANISEVLEELDSLCSNELGHDLDSNPNVATEFTDEYGNPTDEEGYINAVHRMDEGIERWGETHYYLQKQTGISPDEMVFEEENDSERATPILDVFAGSYCSGERLARVMQLNKCYAAVTGASFLLHERIPSRCILNSWASLTDCTGDSAALATANSQPGCFSGTTFNSIRLDCIQLQ